MNDGNSSEEDAPNPFLMKQSSSWDGRKKSSMSAHIKIDNYDDNGSDLGVEVVE